MPYIGNSPQQSVRQRYHYTATAGQTTFSGTDIYGLILKYTDSEYVDVYLNGVLLQKIEDYTATSLTSVVLASGAQADDLIEIVVYGVFSVSDTVSASRGGTFANAINVNSNLVVSGNINVSSDLAVTGNLRVGTGSVVITNNSVTIAGSNISPVQSFRNKIINGEFDFWQRQTSNTNVVSGQYVADRWINIKTGTPTLNISRQTFTHGQTDVSFEPDYFYRANTISSTGAANGIYIAQRVESVKTLAGQVATLSFYAKADSSKNVAVEFVQNFGTNGSAEANGINVTTYSLTSSWQKFNTTITLPSLSGKTVDSANANYLAVNFWLDAGSNFNSRTNSLGQRSGTFDIAQVQLEAGSVATPFEVRPLGVELLLCQRFYQTAAFNAYAVNANFGSYNPDYYYPTTLLCTMRASPTITRTGVTDSGVTGGIVGTTKDSFSVQMELTAAAGQSTFTWNASAEL